jgi:hypothetical protein
LIDVTGIMVPLTSAISNWPLGLNVPIGVRTDALAMFEGIEVSWLWFIVKVMTAIEKFAPKYGRKLVMLDMPTSKGTK